MFSRLKAFEVVYVATTSVWFEKAARMFVRVAPDPAQRPTPLAPDELELLDYFQVRRKFETRDFAGLDTERIVRYREEKRRYGDAAHEELYRRWLGEGESALRQLPLSQSAHGMFRPMLIPHDYDIFGGIERAS